MSGGTIDVASATFWLLVVAAAVVLTPIVVAGPRRVALAVVNLAVLCLLLRHNVVLVLAGVGCAWLVLRTFASTGWRRWSGGAALLVLFGLFTVHKLPPLAREARLG